MSDKTIEVRGLRELRGALNKIDREMGRELRDALAEASKLVVTTAQGKVPVRSRAASDSIKVRKQTAAAAVAVGGSDAPYFPWLDFGGRTGRGKRTVRPFRKEGRYVYPALRERRADITEIVDKAVGDLARKAGFE